MRRLRVRTPISATRVAPGGGQGRDRRDRSGIALLMVLGTLMFMIVLVTDISYGSRVRFLTAVHERDEAKAQWIALTGVNVYRLVLTANAQLANSSFGSQLDAFGINAGDALWQMIPFINTGLLRMFSSDSTPDDEDIDEFAQTGTVSDEAREESREKAGTRFGNRNFLDFDGDFSAEVRGEDCRVNINYLGDISTDANWQEDPTALQIYGLLSGEENEQFLRDRNLERWDLVGNLKDWVDADTNVSSGKGGYEDDYYNTLRSPYLSKNADFDSLEELRMVEGWQDDVYARFGSQLTIYGSGKVNVNCAEDEVIGGLIRAYGNRAFTDDELQIVVQQLREQMALSSFSKGSDFVKYLTGTLNLDLKDGLSQKIDTKTTVFTVTSTGQVGDAVAKITAVLNFSENKTGGAVKYWRVD